MKKTPSSEGALRLPAPDFSLEHTLESAQLFRVAKRGGGYVAQAGDLRFFARQDGDVLEIAAPAGSDGRFFAHFFALDELAGGIFDRLARLPELAEAVEACRGLRLLRQDPWECLVGFVCSACCNVPRIQRIVGALCDAAGKRIGSGRAAWRGFPDAGELPGEAAMRRLGAGYRAAYLARLNEPRMRWLLEGLRLMDFADARAALRELPGVGEKVADCVLLYSLGFRQAFPVDTWVRRAVQETYFGGKRVPDRDIQRLAAERFGPDAGYAQQFLFHAWRTKKLKPPS